MAATVVSKGIVLGLLRTYRTTVVAGWGPVAPSPIASGFDRDLVFLPQMGIYIWLYRVWLCNHDSSGFVRLSAQSLKLVFLP